MAKENAVVKKNAMSWDESMEAGPEEGQGRGKLVSYDWVTKSSPGLWRVIRVNIVMQFLLLCSSELYSVSCRIMF